MVFIRTFVYQTVAKFWTSRFGDELIVVDRCCGILFQLITILFTMKLKLDAIQSKYMPLTMQGQQVVQPVLKIVAGDFEATTSRYCIILRLQALQLRLTPTHIGVHIVNLEWRRMALILFFRRLFNLMSTTRSTSTTIFRFIRISLLFYCDSATKYCFYCRFLS